MRLNTNSPMITVVQNVVCVMASKLPNKIWYKSVVLLIILIKMTPNARNAVKLMPIAASGFVLLLEVINPINILAIIPVINAPTDMGMPNKNDNATPGNTA